MLEFKAIVLEDKNLINHYLMKIKPHIIEQSFNTLFPWQKAYNYQWAIFEEDWLIIKSTYKGVVSFFPPIGSGFNLKKPLTAILAWCRAQQIPCVFSDVGELELLKMKKSLPDFFYVKQDRNNANYVYKVEDLIKLAGKKYYQKKHHLNSFKRTYPDYEFLPLNNKMVVPCKEALARWCQENNCTLFPTLMQESQAILTLLDNLGDLDYFGACIALNGRVEAFTIGEILNTNTLSVIIEKANGGFNGLYTAINQQFLENYWQDFEYVNRAEDMGLANLRKTKMSYYPNYLEMKYLVKPYNQVMFKPSMGEGL